MPMDGLMLGFVERELNLLLQEGRVDRIIQPERDEIHLTIRAKGSNYRLLLSSSANAARVHISEKAKIGPQEPPMFCMLLRKYLSGARIVRISQINADRILSITFTTLNELGDPVEVRLITEMMGRHSNIILVNQNGRIIDAARHVGEDISRVRQIEPGLPYLCPPAQNKIAPEQAAAPELQKRLALESGRLDKAILHIISGFSPQAASEAAYRLCGESEASVESLNLPALASGLEQYLHSLPNQSPCIITLAEDGMPSDVFPFPQQHLSCETRSFLSPSAALEAFFDERDRREHMKQRASTLSRLVYGFAEKSEKKIAIQEEALQNAARMDEYRRNGELLQANLYCLKKGSEVAEVQDYYSEGCPMIRIPMDVSLSPAQNAQRYFKLYRKARGAKQLAAEQKAKAETELNFLEQMEDDLRKATTEKDLSELRSMLEAEGYIKRPSSRMKPRKEAPSQPFKYLSADGTEIEVGKNALQNEKLTLSAKGDETWLHAQKMPGSHVIIHSDHPSEETISSAALLAAWYSKGCRSANVPVDMTLRRYIKKPGGTPAGFVIYTHQQTLYITPLEAEVMKLKCVQS